MKNMCVMAQQRRHIFKKEINSFYHFLRNKTNLFIVAMYQDFSTIWAYNHTTEKNATFLDSSKRSLKCVLLHNGSKFGAVPTGHSSVLKEQQEDIKILMDMFKCHGLHALF